MPDIFQIRKDILEYHQRHLGDHFAAIVLCGSITYDNKVFTEYSDVDFIVIVKSVNAESMLACAGARLELEAVVPASVSNTIISTGEVERYVTSPESLDSKAAQALLESHSRQSRIVGAGPEFVFPELPSESAIRRYSMIDFGKLETVVRSLIGRGDKNISHEIQRKIAKISLICLKRKLQFDEPRRFVDTSAPGYESIPSESDALLYEYFQSVKRDPAAYSAEEQLVKTLAFFEESQQYFQSSVL